MAKIPDINDTIIALATALGSGSIAVIRLSGKKAIEITNAVFDRNILKKAANTTHFGRICDKNKEMDQVVVSLFKKPNSYTGEDVVEISCHANNFIVKEILNLFTSRGVRIAEPGEFTLRAFLNGKIDLSQAESVAEIINSKSGKGVRNSLLHLEGRLRDKIHIVKQDILDIISMLELDIDFSEEGLEIAPPDKIIGKTDDIILEINKLASTYNYARMMRGNIDITIAGKPNVGKSSLLNCLLGENRVIVNEKPGTTRDTIKESLLIDNILVNLIDTAGIRVSDDSIEFDGITRAKKHLEDSDLILFVFDVSQPLRPDDNDIFKQAGERFKEKAIFVGNKTDLGFNPGTKKFFAEKKTELIEVSAKQATGIDHIKESISKRISKNIDQLEDEIIITSTRQIKLLGKTLESLKAARETVARRMGNEFAAVDFRNALNYLGEIVGEISSEDILNNIFGKFCIGK